MRLVGEIKLRTYADAEAFLNGFLNYEKLLGVAPVRYGTKEFDLARFRLMLGRLGNPQRACTSFHVAGTKGKGSTSALIHSVLRAHGLRTGLFTSPHLVSYCERIVLDGEPVNERDFCALLEQLAPLACAEPRDDDSPHGLRTVFELLTAAAFVHFSASACDAMVIETGLGGRLDSTNVFDDPPFMEGHSHCAVITSIGYDHTAILGDTIGAIAAEKAGILQRHGAAVLGEQPEDWAEDVGDAVSATARRKGVAPPTPAAGLVRIVDVGHRMVDGRPRLRARLASAAGAPRTASGLSAALAHGLDVDCPLVGAHQAANIQTAVAALMATAGDSGAIGSPGVPLDPIMVQEGIRSVRWPGRFEVVSTDPTVVVDGAHCPLSAAALAATFRLVYGDRPVVLVSGFLRDKAAARIASALVERLGPRIVVTCPPPCPRAADGESIARAFREGGADTVVGADGTDAALNTALASVPAGGAVVVTGSLFMVGPARTFFGL